MLEGQGEDTRSAWKNMYALSDMSWEIPLALLFISTNWWENFCDKDIRIGCLYVPVKSYKDTLYRVRTKAYMVASLWKIGLTVGFAFLLVPDMTLLHVAFGDLFNPPYNTNSSFLSDNRNVSYSTISPFFSANGSSASTFMSPATLNIDGVSYCNHSDNSNDHNCIDNWRYFINYLPAILQVRYTQCNERHHCTVG